MAKKLDIMDIMDNPEHADPQIPELKSRDFGLPIRQMLTPLKEKSGAC